MSIKVEELAVGDNASVLNGANPEALRTVLTSNVGTEPLRSDCDEQLLISLPFPSAVRLHSLSILGGGTAPKSVKLFINNESLAFDDVEDTKPLHAFELSAKDVGGGTIMLPFCKFQFVTNLTIFISDNQADDEITTVDRIQLFGQRIAPTDMKEFKKVG